MNSLRAIHVVPRLIAESSGPSHTVPHLCRSLTDSGVAVELHVLEPLPVRELPYPATAYPTTRLPGAYRLGVSPRMAAALEQAAHAADILHTHSLWMMPNIYPGRVARRSRCKLVISPRGTLEPWAWRRSRWRKALIWYLGQARTLRAADLFHATARSEYEAIRARGFTQQVALIPNGVHIPERRSRGSVEAKRSLLFLSRIHPKKQVDLLLRVWRRLEPAFPDWHLTVAGPLGNPYARAMENLAPELGGTRVTFPGELHASVKLEALGAADLFVLPTRSENFGLAIAEALASGVPVITTHGAPWAGLVSHGCGWWIPDSEVEIEQTLQHAMSRSRAELRAMGARGRAWMQQSFSWHQVGAQMATTYRWLLGQADRPEWVLE